MFMSRVLYAINTRPTQALARYVAHHPRVTYLLLLAAALLAAKYSHRLRRLLVSRPPLAAAPPPAITRHPSHP